VKITWWGHATATVTLGATSVLTDPLLVDRLGHLRRQVPGVPLQARSADVAVVSHLHADHLHIGSLRLLGERMRIVVPHGARDLIRGPAVEVANRVEEIGPGERLQVGDVEIEATPAHHDGRRRPGSRHKGPALGFVLRNADSRVWFAGDTGLFAGLDAIAPVDVALVPVGGWGPTLGPHHLDPEQAVEAVHRVGAHHAVPLHYGTFWPAGLRRASPTLFRTRCVEPGAQFAAAASGFAAHVIAPGESVQL
jgi:L-ascorbate metabolism protein UlaG (beta-lactamase superfamily)